MYAIIALDGRQYRVEPGMTLDVSRLPGEPGETLTVKDCVLLISSENGVQVGSPVIADATVDLEIVEHFRGPKVVVFKMKRRKRYRRKQGHRQEMTRVRIATIRFPGEEPAAAAATTESDSEASGEDAS